MKVLVIPEDFRKDQYVLKPRVRQLCPEDVGALENRIRAFIAR